MAMPDSEAKRRWMQENSIVFSIKLMRRTEADIIDYIDKRMAKGASKGSIIKAALREYMKNHPEE